MGLRASPPPMKLGRAGGANICLLSRGGQRGGGLSARFGRDPRTAVHVSYVPVCVSQLVCSTRLRRFPRRTWVTGETCWDGVCVSHYLRSPAVRFQRAVCVPCVCRVCTVCVYLCCVSVWSSVRSSVFGLRFVRAGAAPRGRVRCVAWLRRGCRGGRGVRPLRSRGPRRRANSLKPYILQLHTRFRIPLVSLSPSASLSVRASFSV